MRYFITLLLLFLVAFCPVYASQWTTGGTAGGAGDVVGPASSTDNAVARFDGITGKLLQNSLVTIGDTGIITVPVGSVTAPSIVADDADSGFYFGSKGFNWSADGVNKFGLDSSGNLNIVGVYKVGGGGVLTGNTVSSNTNDVTSIIQNRTFSAADNMVEMAIGTATFTGFDGEIVGVQIMPIVGVLDDGDTMTLLKLSPAGTPASTLGLVYGLSFGNWGGTGTDKAAMINLNATGYDADIVRRWADITCAATVCDVSAVPGATSLYVTTTGVDTMTIADGTFRTQRKFISHKVDGGSLTVTPTNFSAGTSVTMAAAGNTLEIEWNGTKWDMVVFYNAVLNP